jgi:hypothetical protein
MGAGWQDSNVRPEGDGWVDVIDPLTMHPDVRRKVVQLLAESTLRCARAFTHVP